ncbi:MAG: M24 family metallopeptidase [Eubacteriales bacterium]
MFKRVIEKIRTSEFEAYLVTNEANRNYLCCKGNYFLPGVMLITEEEVYLATPSRNINYFKSIYSEYTVLAGGVAELADIAKKLEITRMGYESTTITMQEFTNVLDIFGGVDARAASNAVEFIPAPDFIEDIRMIKTPAEIELLQQATKLSDQAYLEFLNHLKVGMTEKQARATFDHIFMSLGADEFSFPTLLSSGARAFMPHSVPTDKVIERGDLVLMDFGIVLNGYCSDTTRTVVMGNANERQKAVYNLVLKSQIHALDNIKAGMTCREADALARDVIVAELGVGELDFGLGQGAGCFDYGLGHGIGMLVHEKPRFHPNSDYILSANTAMSVEPGIYIEGWGGIRIEDILIIGEEKGGRNLTTAPKDQLLEI